ncbi:MAG: SdrD B-like domain-containing protein, partial [Planctomycetota bacterium]
SGYVYHDQSDDGVFDSAEDPIAGVTLKLLDSGGNETGRTAITNADGYYEFTDLAPGKYTVMEQQPDGWLDGKDTPGSTGGDASVNDMIAEIMIAFGSDSTDNNFGELLPGSIAGRVHASNDGDCDFDDPDVLLSGVTIELLNADGNVIETTQTNAAGEYLFDNLPPGTYSVREIQPDGYFDGDERVGSAGGVLTGTDTIAGIELGSDEDAVRYDFCEHVGAMLSGYVYHDASDDGLFDSNEDPIAGVELTLLDAAGAVVATTTTDDQGFYKFNNLDAGTYTVVEAQPNGFFDGKDTAGTSGGDTSVNDVISAITLGYGGNSEQNNFGELLAASVGGRVHAENGTDCDFDNPDILLEGVTIQLLDADGNVLQETQTDAGGQYRFDNLPPGEYQIRELQPTALPDGRALFDGGENIGDAGGTASDDLISGIVLGSGEDALGYHFCEHLGATISGYVYHDQSDDGVFDPAED